MNTIKSIILFPTVSALSAEEQLVLVRNAKKGDEEARIRLFCSVKSLIIKKLCKRYDIVPHFWNDAILATYPGFEEALKRFTVRKGRKFSTYAFYWLRFEFMQWMRKESTIRVPVKMCKLLAKLEDYLNMVGRESSFPWYIPHNLIDGFCQVTGYDQITVEVLVRSRRIFNTEALIDDDEELTETTIFPPGYLYERPVEREVLKLLKEEALNHAMEEALDDKERTVLELRYGMNGYVAHKLSQVGPKVGITTKEGVRKAQIRGLKKIRVFLLANYPHLCFAS